MDSNDIADDQSREYNYLVLTNKYSPDVANLDHTSPLIMVDSFIPQTASVCGLRTRYSRLQSPIANKKLC